MSTYLVFMTSCLTLLSQQDARAATTEISVLTPTILSASMQIEHQAKQDIECRDIEIMSQSLLAQYSKQALVIIRIFDDFPCEDGTPVYDVSLEMASVQRKALMSQTNICAELVRTKLGTSIRIRQSSGKTSKCWAGSKDPLKVEVDSRHITLVWISMWRYIENRPQANFFAITTESINSAEASRLFLTLKKEYPIEVLSLQISTSAWFPEDSMFPANYPFEGLNRIPSLDELGKSGRIHCEKIEKFPLCSGKL